MQAYKTKFIEFMVASGVLTFGDFTTKSGRKTPFFINTGNYNTGLQMARLGIFYAQTLHETLGSGFDCLFGPAYKGIPLVTVAGAALATEFNTNVGICFNRKEAKDHGEGGSLIGYQPRDGERIVIVEDVTTAGTSVRESIPFLKSIAEVEITALIVSVDRQERGQGSKSALAELQEEFGLQPIPIVTLDEIVAYLHNREIDGQVILDDSIKAAIDAYRAEYGAKS
ncbi:MAG: orotate phosphoribosyltransferase [Planctomycetes bacterium]|nr:orotate phosphoribosyltransferase [Planctomycetota bacterium]